MATDPKALKKDITARVSAALSKIQFRRFSDGRARHVYEVLNTEEARRRHGPHALLTLAVSVDVASRLLGIEPPNVRLLSYCSERDAKEAIARGASLESVDTLIGGYASKSDRTIAVDLFRDTERVMRTAAHECRHIWQYDTGERRGRDICEPDAIAFADVFMEHAGDAIREEVDRAMRHMQATRPESIPRPWRRHSPSKPARIPKEFREATGWDYYASQPRGYHVR